MLRFIFIFSFLLSSAFCFSVIPPLEREVTLSVVNERVSIALNKMAEQTGLVFSYSSSIINDLPPISINVKHKTVREALALILPNNISFKSKNNYIILKERSAEKNPKKTELSGYVYDKTTDKKLANVTIYDKTSLQSVTTNDYGYYSMSIPIKNQSIIINKENYKDTSIILADLQTNSMTFINLSPVDSTKKDSVLWKQKLREFENYTTKVANKFSAYINTLNVKDTLSREFQVSLLPYMGTNHKLSGSVYNKYSFNIFGGYARGVKALEIGGFFNIDKENVHGAQLAGFFNLVGDTVKGAQLAGFFNVTGKSMKGFQAAGFTNVNLGELNGVSASGFVNANFGKVKGAQFAGYVNYAKSIEGIQGAGFVNCALREVKGLQVAGFVNHAKELEGTQIAGFVNHAKHVKKGFQIAVVNISDSCKGLPIGVFSFVKSGVHQLEISGDEIFKANVGFRTGVPEFYNIFNAGIAGNGDEPLWSFGYGLGTSFKIKNKLRSDITLTANHVSKGEFKDAESELYKLYWGIEYKFKKQFSIAAGPVFNLYVSDTYSADYLTKYSNIAPYSLYDFTTNNGFNLKGWVGGKISIRFF
jgi:hypothetical protein